ncbi:MAG: diguanylate cyclase [Pseudomonadota bacterium]
MTVVCGVLSAVFILQSKTASALELDSSDHSILDRAWNQEDGLPASNVWKLTQAQDGYLWLATDKGAVRFDGSSFDTFNGKTHQAFAVDDTRAIYETADGDLWFGTYGGGLVRKTGDTFRAYGVESGLEDKVVYSVTSTSDGTVWVGTARSACQMKEDETFRCYTSEDGFGSTRVFRMVEAADGTLWFSSLGGGVTSLRGSKFRNWGAKDGFSDDPVLGLHRDPDYGMLFATYTGQFFAFSGSEFQRLDFGELPPETLVANLYRDRDSNLWVSTINQGLWQVYPTLQRVQTSNTVPSTYDLLEDRSGDLWLATVDGLRSIAEAPFVAFGEPEQLADQTFVVEASARARIWAGSEGQGLYWLDPDGKRGSIDRRDGLPSDSVSALTLVGEDRLLVGTFNGGIAWLENEAVVRTFTTEDGLPSNQVAAIHQDRDGHTWVATSGGLVKFESERIVQVFGPSEGIPSMVRSISETTDGKLWLATDYGLIELSLDESRVLRLIDENSGLASTVTTSTLVDSSGVLWIGGRNGDLTRYQQGRFFAFSDEHNLGVESIMGMVQDTRGYLWFGGRTGIARIALDDLNEVASGTLSAVTTRLMSERDGLRTTRVPGGYQRPMVLDKRGRVWFATTKGLARVDPASFGATRKPPNLNLEAFRVDGTVLERSEGLIVPVGAQSLEIDYSAPELRDGESLKFRYRIASLDDRWQDAGTRRTAFFTSLPAGEQRFEVQTIYTGQRWSDDVTSLTLNFAVAPRWYQTTAARLALVLLVLLMAWLLYSFALANAKSRERRLRELVEERTSALRSARDEMRRMSLTDPLTQIPNRRHFEERMTALWDSAWPRDASLGVMIVDVDHFKAYNDAAGHQAGDHVLQRVAGALLEGVREGDFVARYGGEEFILLLGGSDTTGTRRVAERLQESIRKLGIRHPGVEGVVTVSAGLATAVPRTVSAESLIKSADNALYAAKAEGRDRLKTFETSQSIGLTAP